MFRVKPGVNLLDMLKANGYSSYRIAQEKMFGSATVQKFRRGGLPSWNELDKLCKLLHCHPVDLLEYIPDDE